MKRSIFLIILINFLVLVNSFAQENNIDSLKQLIKSSKQDTSKIKTYIEIGDNYEFITPDTAIYYYKKALDLSDELIGDKTPTPKLSKTVNTLFILKAKALSYTGIINTNLSKYDEALTYYLEALKINEQIEYKYDIGRNLSYIGNVYHYESDYDKALEYYKKSLKIYEEINYKDGIAANLGNIGIIYYTKNKVDEALKYYFKTIKIYEEINSKSGVATNLGNVAIVYNDKKEYKKALEYYLKALKIFKEIGNKRSIALNLVNIGGLYNDLKQYNKAIKYAKEALKIAKEISSLDQQKEAYLILSEANKGKNNYSKALNYKDLWIKMNDSIFSYEKTKTIEEMSAKYESDKKEAQIKNQQAELKASKLEIEKEKIQRQMSIIALSLMAIIAFFIFWSFIQKRKANKRLRENKYEIEAMNEELSQANEELSTSIEVITKHKDEIELKNKSINSSIVYASKIQKALLPSFSELKEQTFKHFILYKPKDIVSGDFYWYKRIGDNIFFAVADATGHGVPGAFMSTLGIVFLNEIIKETNNVANILNILRTKIKTSLHQTKNVKENCDGIDMSLISINIKKLSLEFAGAYNPILIIRNNELIELKADRMPVGIAINDNKDFTKKDFILQKDDTLYMFSDGFQDQINEETEKKFMLRHFKELLLECSKLPIEKQEDFLNNTFNNWQGKFQQIDDVLVVGIRI